MFLALLLLAFGVSDTLMVVRGCARMCVVMRGDAPDVCGDAARVLRRVWCCVFMSFTIHTSHDHHILLCVLRIGVFRRVMLCNVASSVARCVLRVCVRVACWVGCAVEFCVFPASLACW